MSMDEDLHHIDDLFRKGIGQYDDTPSGDVWEKLDKQLDKRKVISISRKYNKLKWVAAVLFLCTSAIGMYTWNMRSRMSRGEAGNRAVQQTHVHPSGASAVATDSAHQLAGKGQQQSTTQPAPVIGLEDSVHTPVRRPRP